jgi:hypothetical protein
MGKRRKKEAISRRKKRIPGKWSYPNRNRKNPLFIEAALLFRRFLRDSGRIIGGLRHDCMRRKRPLNYIPAIKKPPYIPEAFSANTVDPL